ncbi:hypothetical protein JOQ06_008452 [Pogonophryne albipinna]|uniref:Uncharacterized protein n=1 Tax=Pogonophryne albipinna TaxID=1090488 RepID=A0AAD6AKD0_9TELE|nr:hypothetical protein JOQ06_008452 [Pogonophryne albipinna]
MLGDSDRLICRGRPAFNRLLPSRLAPAAPALGAKSRRSAPICPALRLQHCTNLGSSAAQGRDSHGPRGGHSPGPTVDLYHFRRFGPVHLSQTPWPHEQRHSRDV